MIFIERNLLPTYLGKMSLLHGTGKIVTKDNMVIYLFYRIINIQ